MIFYYSIDLCYKEPNYVLENDMWSYIGKGSSLYSYFLFLLTIISVKRTFHILTRRHITNRRFEGCRSVSVKKLHIEINRLVASFLNPSACYYEDKESLLGERIDRYEQWDKTKLLISLRNMVRFNISRNSELWISVAFPKSMKQICCYHATAWISENRTPVLFIAHISMIFNQSPCA